MIPFDFNMLFQGLIDAAGTFYTVIRGPLAALLLAAGTCVGGTGCKKTIWNAQVTNGRTSTQFEVSWGTTVKIGFPGHFDFGGEAAGTSEDDVSGDPIPAPVKVTPKPEAK